MAMSKTQPEMSSRQQIVVSSLARQGDDREYYADLSPRERLAMVWPLTLTAWKFKYPDGFESRLSRHVTHVEQR